jgi:hypothetical protein
VKRALAIVTWKWSPPPVRSPTAISVASGKARRRSSSRRALTRATLAIDVWVDLVGSLESRLSFGSLTARPLRLLLGERLALVRTLYATLSLLSELGRFDALALDSAPARRGPDDDRKNDYYGDDDQDDQPGIHVPVLRRGARAANIRRLAPESHRFGARRRVTRCVFSPWLHGERVERHDAESDERLAGESTTTTDHEEIRSWVEQRGGRPARVRDTERGGAGILRIDYPGVGDEESLEEIAWDECFEAFEDNRLAFLYQEETKEGEESRFSKLVSRNGG